MLNFGKILLKFAIVSNIFQYFLSFSEFNDHYWPTKLLKSWSWVTFETKNCFELFFTAKLFLILPFSAFLYDLFINKARKG